MALAVFNSRLNAHADTFSFDSQNFFAVVSALAAEAKSTALFSDGQHHFGAPELDLLARLESSQLAFRESLCDSFNTLRAVQVLRELVSAANVYLARGRSQVNVAAVRAVEDWVTRMLRMFGLGEGSPMDARGERVVGWGKAVVGGEEVGAVDKEEVVLPYLRALSAFRDKVRQLAMKGAPASEILALSDELRDVELIELGVSLDDQDGKHLQQHVSDLAATLADPAPPLRSARRPRARQARRPRRPPRRPRRQAPGRR